MASSSPAPATIDSQRAVTMKSSAYPWGQTLSMSSPFSHSLTTKSVSGNSPPGAHQINLLQPSIINQSLSANKRIHTVIPRIRNHPLMNRHRQPFSPLCEEQLRDICLKKLLQRIQRHSIPIPNTLIPKCRYPIQIFSRLRVKHCAKLSQSALHGIVKIRFR